MRTSEMTEPRNLIVGLDLFRSSGGPSKTIKAFRDALDANVYSFVDPRQMAIEPFAVEGTIGVPASSLPLARQLRIPRLSAARTFIKQITQSRFVSCHSFYRYHNFLVYRFWKQARIPYWFVPHGVLDPWVMTYGSVQKKLFWQTIGKRFLADASTVIFATEAERDKAAAQFDLPAADVIPWPVDLVDITYREDARRRIRQKLGIGEDDRVLLYFGRLHHMKRPLETIEVVAKAGIENLHLVIVGNEHTVSFDDCRRAARSGNIQKCVHLVGPVYGESKYDYLHASDAYISLSHRENFNHTAAESLAAGLPVILSPGNDLQSMLESANCSWGLPENTVDDAVEMIRRFSKMDISEVRAMGARGRKWVGDNLSFNRFAAKIRAVADRCTKRM